MTAIEDFKNCWITLAQEWPSDNDIAAWQASGQLPYSYAQQHAPNRVSRPDLQQQIADLSSQVSQGQTALDEAEQTIASVNAQLKDASDKIDSLNEQVKELQEAQANQPQPAPTDGQPDTSPEPEPPVETETPASKTLLQLIIDAIRKLLGGK